MTTFTTEDRIAMQQLSAYNLADKIIKPDCFREYIIDAVRMLKNQADEIDALRHQIKHLEAQVYGGTTK